MFCPKCRYAYNPGVTVCADCGVPLVSELPLIPKPEFVEYAEVLITFNPGDIAVIKSLLDSEGITYYFHGEFFNYVRPLADPARLMVRKDQVYEAKEILKDLKITYTVSFDDKGSGAHE